MTPGVFSSGHFIPYIFMEWDLLAVRHKENLSARTLWTGSRGLAEVLNKIAQRGKNTFFGHLIVNPEEPQFSLSW